jgi:hypothetical protein
VRQPYRGKLGLQPHFFSKGESHDRAGFIDIGRLVAVAAAKAADQESYAESYSCCCIGTLLDCCTKKILGFAGALANGFRGAGGCVLGLTVQVLYGTFHLGCLALELAFHISGSPPISLLDLAAKVFGGAGPPIFIHESILHRLQIQRLRQAAVPEETPRRSA